MKNYKTYSKLIVRSVNHIFKNFLQDQSVTEIVESKSGRDNQKVSIEIEGSLKGELIINFQPETLNLITKHFIPNSSPKTIKKHYEEVAGEIANLITGTFANQLQFHNLEIRLSAPEFNDDTETTRTLYDSINLSFDSRFGGFDVDLYYREEG